VNVGTMDSLHFVSLTELASRLRAREISPVEATELQLSRIAALDGQLNSYALVTPESALAAARSAEESIAAGRYLGPLHGVPLAVKDLFWTKDTATSGGMPMYRQFRPPEDATVVARLKQAGAVLLGKLQMTEGAYSDHHPAVEPPRNPWNADYWPGISSSGPAVATAAGLCYGAVASDTGGSIRWPCGANGLTGLKPTWGRVSRFGAMALAPSMDHVGPIARSTRDVAAIYSAISGPDVKDPTSLFIPGQGPVSASDLQALRIGVDPQWNSADVDASVQRMLSEAMAVFRSLGSRTVELTSSHA
jgi:amidase